MSNQHEPTDLETQIFVALTSNLKLLSGILEKMNHNISVLEKRISKLEAGCGCGHTGKDKE